MLDDIVGRILLKDIERFRGPKGDKGDTGPQGPQGCELSSVELFSSIRKSFACTRPTCFVT
jgi:hypothetical protein